jgi:hypothetical protein
LVFVLCSATATTIFGSEKADVIAQLRKIYGITVDETGIV